MIMQKANCKPAVYDNAGHYYECGALLHFRQLQYLEGNEGRVYELICRHFLACVSKDATGSETIVTINIAGEKFTATGLVIYERNYLDVYIYDKWNAKQIHNYEQAQRFEPTEITMPEGHTTAPPLLTEADLIALMEKHGIGTDATHAEHINTIKERGYIGVVDKGSLVPGVIGMGLYEGYDAMELALAKPMLRAEFEQDLKKICLGEKDPKAVLVEQIAKYKDAYKQIMDKITAMDEKMSHRILETPAQSTTSNNNTSDTNSQTRGAENQNRLQEVFKCPKCSIAPMALKPKKNQSGFLIGCLNFPDCKNCIWWPEDCKNPNVLDETCSKCGSDIKLLKFKFSNPYHKTLFNSPSGWYKMCLRCDVQFRNLFNINLETVKRVGAIVGDLSSIPINYGITQQPSSSSSSSNSGNNNAGKRSKTTAKKSKDLDTKTESKTKKATTSTSKQSKKTSNSNIRSYFTSAAQQTAEEIAASELQNMPLDAFFDSNDGFDELVSSIEPNQMASNQAASTTSRRIHETDLNEDLAAAFNDEDDDMFADLQWGSGNRSVTEQTASVSNTSARGHDLDVDESFGDWLQNDSDNKDDYVWGSAAKNARLSETAPNPKRPKYQQTVTSNVEDVGWGSTSRTNKALSSAKVKCTGCHQAAKELSVKRDGPNKGRCYFVCQKSNPCKFFQWADEVPMQSQPARVQIADDAVASRSNWSQNPKQTDTAGTSGSSRDVRIEESRDFVNCNCNKPANNLTVRKEGPNKGRDFYACANRDQSCGFFKWADEMDTKTKSSPAPSRAENSFASSSNWGSSSSTSNVNTTRTSNSWNFNDVDLPDEEEENVNCNCHKPANSLTVRKDGPNKGRGFYACANRDKSCGFFQWANQSASQDSQRSWGSAAATEAKNKKPAASSSVGTSKGRKCGLCRQEGHTRQKCPRKGEFEF